jgi:hypothetical protein
MAASGGALGVGEAVEADIEAEAGGGGATMALASGVGWSVPDGLGDPAVSAPHPARSRRAKINLRIARFMAASCTGSLRSHCGGNLIQLAD